MKRRMSALTILGVLASSPTFAGIDTITTDGVWTWFNDPRAVYHAGRLYVGWITKDQAGTPRSRVQFASYDFNLGRATIVDLSSDFEADDHNNPAIIRNSDGTFTAYYTQHGTVNDVFYRNLSMDAHNNITPLTPQQTIPKTLIDATGAYGFTYANPWQLSNDGGRSKRYLFSRGPGFWPVYRVFDNNQWASTSNLVANTGQRPYIKYHSDGVSKIYFAFTEGHPASVNNSIYFAYIQKGAYYRANGTLIKNMSAGPLLFSELGTAKVFDKDANATVTGTNSWIWDLATEASDRPVVVFATFPSVSQHQYHWARWDGTKWVDRTLVANAGGSIAGSTTNELYYSGGIALDHSDPNIVYLCRQVSGKWNLEQWKTANAGANWTVTTIADGTGSSDENFRPYVPLNRPPGIEMVLWINGLYDYFTPLQGNGYNTKVKLWTKQVAVPPGPTP